MTIENMALLNRYQEVMEAAGYVIFTTNVAGCFSHVENSIEALTEYPANDLLGQPFTFIVDSEWHTRVDEYFSTVDKTGEKLTFEFPIITKSGTRRWVEQTVVKVTDGADVTFQSICQDITNRKSEQTRYRALFEQNNDAIFILDLAGKHIAANTQATKLFGYSQDELATLSYQDMVDGSEIALATSRLERILNGEKLAVYERLFRHKDGSIIQAEVNTQLVSDANGNPLHIQSIVRDIGARKQAEKELRNRESLYRTLARHLPKSAILIYDRDLRYLVAEGEALEQTGYYRDKVEGSTIYEVLGEEGVTQLESAYRKALAGETLNFEYSSDGHYYNVQIVPIYSDDGTIFAGMIVVQDITAEKAQHDALLTSEARIRAMLKAIPDLMFVLRQDGTYVDFHRFESGDVETDAHLLDFGLDAEIMETTFEKLNLALTTGEVQQYLYESSVDDPIDDDDSQSAELNAYEARVVALNHEEALIIIRNTSDLKQAQSKLSERVEQLTILHQFDEELADRLDIDYVLNMALDASVRLSQADSGYIGLQDEDGAFSLAKVAGDHIHEIADNNLRTGIGAVSRIIRKQQPELIPDVSVDPDYITNRHQTKSQITAPLLSQNHEVIGVLNLESNRFGVFTEDIFNFIKLITRRISAAIENARLYQQVEQQLKQLRILYERVMHLEQLKTDMIRIASHDLRNPLSTVLGYAEMSKYELDGTEGDIVEYVDLIYQSARKMQKIIIDILSLERIEELAEETEKREFLINQLVQSVYEDNESEARMRGKTLELNTVNRKIETFGDPIQIREAITNLVTNAIKYTGDNGKITMSLLIRNQQVVVEVVDNGQGIRQDQQERLFQPFYRARTEENANIEGTGLGLHLVKNIIERHDGEMIFSSTYGKGSTFGFYLPLKTEQ